MARLSEEEGFSDDEDAPHPANKAIASGVRENTGLGVDIAEEGGEIAPTTAIDKLNKLQSDANACLKRLDKISRNLKLQADGKLPGSQVRATTYPSSVYERMASLGDIDAQIEFARLDLERRKQANMDEKNRFKDMEVSIKKRDDHVKRLEELLKEVPDDCNYM
mmetsp:Transcript_5896/g.10214  ORF Transcript_5896/g.10214 Transcript_5896/m.10214 type:complete len:164 (-) Transcript_5896:168-659(-)|eukprot:CAMPEP_0198205444 /NCGR_PEP_ID=MMETSP1445-20131203/8988_1 /TAXON_ID=36898 /ORGANISM="Pyramimonas sp., Strain CCMP2087" /LENGTH=163 /DNA_ID=CAMNT_0043877765 /DNA_START=151 /DNA_END=642 /DNA_ORIENTATION=-